LVIVVRQDIMQESPLKLLDQINYLLFTQTIEETHLLFQKNSL